MATTTKSKAGNGKSKNPATRETVNKKHSLLKRPTEEQIRRKAQEIYNQRLKRGEHGNELSDWQKAEQLLTES